MDESSGNGRVDLRWLTKDKPCEDGVAPADYDAIDLAVDGGHIYGQVMWPDGSFRKARPGVILLHGFPGTGRNDDLAQALRRIGCVVIVPHHRGAWGSRGTYTFTHCVEDAVTLANEARCGETGRRHNIDPEAVFLAGHSVGGWTSLNAARRLAWLRGLILIAPYDPTYFLCEGEPRLLKELLKSGSVLNSDGPEALFENVRSVRDWSFENAFDAVKDMDVCCAAGTADTVAPFEPMMGRLWASLQNFRSGALRRLAVYPAAHGLCGSRVALAEFAARFIADSLAR